MEATPLEHVVALALATNATGELIVAPPVGLVTATPANDLPAKPAIRQAYTHNFVMPSEPQLLIIFLLSRSGRLNQLINANSINLRLGAQG